MKFIANGYMLGALIIAGLLLTNIILDKETITILPSFFFAFIVALMYSDRTDEKVPRIDRLRAVVVYFVGLSAMMLVQYTSLVQDEDLYFYTSIVFFTFLYSLPIYPILSGDYRIGRSSTPRKRKLTVTGFKLCIVILAGMALAFCQNILEVFSLDSSTGHVQHGVIYSLIFGFILVGSVWSLTSASLIKSLTITLATTCLLIIGVFAIKYFTAHRSEPLSAEYMMIRNEKVALQCLKIGQELTGTEYYYRRYSHHYGNIPTDTTPVCYKNDGTEWEKLPVGWSYDEHADANVSDGTFEFSALSRTGDYIVCTETGCNYFYKLGEVTNIYTNQLTAEVFIPETVIKEGLAGQESILLAEIIIKNPTNEDVLIEGLWLSKNGTAPTELIRYVWFDVEGLISATDFSSGITGNVGEDQLFMPDYTETSLGPNQERKYLVYIRLIDDADAYVGKTIGLNLLFAIGDKKQILINKESYLYTIGEGTNQI